MIKCTECGYENMDGLDYCDGCGAKLNPAAGAGTTAGASASAAPAGEPQPVQTSGAATEAPVSGPVEAPKPSEAPTGEIKPEPAAPEHTATEATQTSAPAAGASTTAEPAAGAAPGAAAPSAAAALRAKFVLVRGGRKGQEFPLEDGNNLVGRWDPETGSFPEVDLEQDDPEAKISRKHALLRIDNGKITVEDIGSLNGTYVNRSPRLQPGNPMELKNGDEIIIGKTFLKLVVEHLS